VSRPESIAVLSLGAWVLLAANLAAEPDPDPAPAPDPSPAPAPAPTTTELLRRAGSDDLDTRLRARRALRARALAHLRARAPDGMVLVPGTVVTDAGGVDVRGGFYLARRETTVAEYNAWLRARKHEPIEAEDGDVPVAGVSLEDARSYARWREARLPTRAELERAATAGGRLRYPWGDEARAHRANTRETGSGGPGPVGAREAGRSVHGVYDLLGNVAEWTSTKHERRRPNGKRPAKFLVVGGSWRTGLPRPGERSFVTYRLAPAQTRPDVGIRLAASLPALPSSFRRKAQGAAPGESAPR